MRTKPHLAGQRTQRMLQGREFARMPNSRWTRSATARSDANTRYRMGRQTASVHRATGTRVTAPRSKSRYGGYTKCNIWTDSSSDEGGLSQTSKAPFFFFLSIGAPSWPLLPILYVGVLMRHCRTCPRTCLLTTSESLSLQMTSGRTCGRACEHARGCRNLSKDRGVDRISS